MDILSVIFSFVPLEKRMELAAASSVFVQAIERSNVSSDSLTDFKKTRHVAFFERHLDKLDWAIVSDNSLLPAEFFRKHEDKVNWENVSSNTSIPLDLLERHINKINYGLSMNRSIPLEFFEKHPEKLHPRDRWSMLIAYHEFNPEIFERHFDLEALCLNADVTVDILEKYSARVGGLSDRCYNNLSGNDSIPIDYIPKSKICWSNVLIYRILTSEWLEANFDQISECGWSELCMNRSVPIEFLERHLEKLDWHCIAQNIALPVEFFERHIAEIKKEPDTLLMLEYNSGIPIEFFEKYTESADWGDILCNSKLSRDFLERHLKDLDWEAVSGNESTPIMFLEDHPDKVNWKNLCSEFSLASRGSQRHWKS